MAFGSVEVEGLAQFRRELRRLDEAGFTHELKDTNWLIASRVADWAKVRARSMGRMEAKAADSLRPTRGVTSAAVTLGGAQAPFAPGSEFGAYRDRLRLRKSTGGRAYLVRRESRAQIDKTIRRIEAQHDQRTGSQSRVTGRVRGWNQFRPWRGSGSAAGYWLYPAIRAHNDEIVDEYGDAIDRITKRAFPD
jgi:hypothetical protein